MKNILKEIQDGSFARVWIRENKTGRTKYEALMKKDLEHPIEKVGAQLRGWAATRREALCDNSLRV